MDHDSEVPSTPSQRRHSPITECYRHSSSPFGPHRVLLALTESFWHSPSPFGTRRVLLALTKSFRHPQSRFGTYRVDVECLDGGEPAAPRRGAGHHQQQHSQETDGAHGGGGAGTCVRQDRPPKTDAAPSPSRAHDWCLGGERTPPRSRAGREAGKVWPGRTGCRLVTRVGVSATGCSGCLLLCSVALSFCSVTCLIM